MKSLVSFESSSIGWYPALAPESPSTLGVVHTSVVIRSVWLQVSLIQHHVKCLGSPSLCDWSEPSARGSDRKERRLGTWGLRMGVQSLSMRCGIDIVRCLSHDCLRLVFSPGSFGAVLMLHEQYGYRPTPSLRGLEKAWVRKDIQRLSLNLRENLWLGSLGLQNKP